MKKRVLLYTLLITTVLVCISMLSVVSFADSPIVIGDINEDGSIDEFDAFLVIQYRMYDFTGSARSGQFIGLVGNTEE